MWRACCSGRAGSVRLPMNVSRAERFTPANAAAGRPVVLPSTASVKAPNVPERPKSSDILAGEAKNDFSCSSPMFSI
jgi:hypothetical protein